VNTNCNLSIFRVFSFYHLTSLKFSIEMEGSSYGRKDDASQMWTSSLRERTGNIALYPSMGPSTFKVLYEHSLVKNVSFHPLMPITERSSKMVVVLMSIYTAQYSTLPCIN